MKKITLIFAMIILCYGIVIAQENNIDNFFDFSNQSGYYVTDDNESENIESDTKEVLPEKYSMIEEGYYTPVRDMYLQSFDGKGESWLFATCAALEGSAVRKYNDNSISFSPLNIYNNNFLYKYNNNHFYCYDYDQLNKLFLGMSYYFNNIGPILEKDDPWISPFNSPKIQPSKPGVAENAYIIANNTKNFGFDFSTRKKIKSFVYNKGPIAITFEYANEYIYDDISFYGRGNAIGNNQIIIVGWDDNYSKEKFGKYTPSDNGAFLCKDSRGENKHDDGYFWLSYYDRAIRQAIGYDYKSSKEINFNNIITYSKRFPQNFDIDNRYGKDDKFNYRYGKAIFNTENNGSIVGIRTYIPVSDTIIEWKLLSGSKTIETHTYKTTYPGYVSLYLDKPYSFSIGDKIQLIIDYNRENISKGNHIPVETNLYSLQEINYKYWYYPDYSVRDYEVRYSYDYNDIIFQPTCIPGTTFYSTDNKTWHDLADEGGVLGVGLLTKETLKVTSVIVSPSTLTLTVGDSNTLTATVKPDYVPNKKVAWSSSNTSVATVSSSGKVTAKGAGTATITCKSNDSGVKGTCKVTVKDIVKVTRVTLNKTSITLNKGKSTTLTATVSPDNAKNKNVTWSSSDTAIATVSSTGKVTAKAAGNTTITVKTEDGGYKATCKVTVKVPVTGVSLNKTEVELGKGKNIVLKATVKPSDATNKAVTWSSSNKNIVYVNSEGKVSVYAPGTATITVKTKDGGFTATCQVTYNAVIGITLDKTNIKLKKGGATIITPTVTPDNATDKTVYWSSNNKTVATVGSNGKVTAKDVGTATITAKTKDGNLKATCKVTVYEPVSGVVLNRTELELKKGKTYTLKATVRPSGATDKTVYWSSSDKNVAYVNSEGKISAYKSGTATITCKTKDGGYTATCDVTVNTPVTGVTLDITEITLKEGESVIIHPTVLPEDASNKSFTLSSSNRDI
ncbi:MAG: Ig-like domain-containing protein, partial [Abditibacteriota bacterium]|nr:Ig-like domain-containing protein [Abditibacteriota bacterium]